QAHDHPSTDSHHPAEGPRNSEKAMQLTLAALVLAASAAGAGQYDEQVRPFLARHCLGCHGAVKPKGGLRLDRLSPDFPDAAGRERWLAVLKRVKDGEMPPKGKPRPQEKEVQALSGWINASVQAAEAARRAQGRVVLRRLNRVEYENTVRDLLGVTTDLRDLLPVGSSS